MEKTKFEKKDTKKTKATFTREELFGFTAGAYAAARRNLYLERIAEREKNPRLNERGHEVLSPISTVADIDMHPLSTRQNLARFVKHTDLAGDGGYDTETDTDAEGRPVYDDRDYYVPDRTDGPPSPHELRAHNLSKKLTDARKSHSEKSKERKSKGETPTHKDTPLEKAIEKSVQDDNPPKNGQ